MGIIQSKGKSKGVQGYIIDFSLVHAQKLFDNKFAKIEFNLTCHGKGYDAKSRHYIVEI